MDIVIAFSAAFALIALIVWLDRHFPVKTRERPTGAHPQGDHESFVASGRESWGEPRSAGTLPQQPHMAALSGNQSFLAGVRSRSCYAVLRDVHGVITTLGIVAIAVLWIVLMNAADGSVDRIYTSVVCALIAAALFIEYGFFRMIVDAVDVLIDTSRRKAEGNG